MPRPREKTLARSSADLLSRLIHATFAGYWGQPNPRDRALVRELQGVEAVLRAGTLVPPSTKRPFGILKKVKVVGYVRVSTSEQGQSGLGLKAQRHAIAEACKSRGWDLVEVFEDTASGARTRGRTGLSAALGAVESGEAQAVMVSRLDRLSRSLLDFAGLMERGQKRGWSLVALDLGVDTTTPSGELTANVIATVAQYERKLIGERTKVALAAKRREGARLGRPRRMPPRVRSRITRLRHQGKSLRYIAETLNREGVPTAQGGALWYPATIAKVLASSESR